MFRAKALFFLAAITAAAQVTSIPSGVGGVGGASNLTTVGAIPYVSAAGILNQTANLSFDVANNRFILGSATVQRFSTDLSLSRASAGVLQVGDGGSNANGTVKASSAVFSTTTNGTPVSLNLSATGTGSDSAVDVLGSGAYINLRSTLAGPYAGTQINKSSNTVLWFTGTQGSDAYGWFTGSSFTSLASLTTGGTFSIYNQTPALGVTRAVIRAGAGQSTTNLTEWQNSGGTVLTRLRSDGELNVGDASALTSGGVYFSSTSLVRWTDSTSTGATVDLSLYRASSGLLEINNGTAGTYRDLTFRIAQWRNGTEATCDSTTRGQVVMVQGGTGVADTFRVCRKDNADAYAWTALY